MAILSVRKRNGTTVQLPDPAAFTWNEMDIDGPTAGRAIDGTMIRDRVAVKHKLDVTWPPLTASEASTILNAIEDYNFSLTYPDAKTGANATRTFYVGDRTAPAYRFIAGRWLWQGLSCSFVEV